MRWAWIIALAVVAGGGCKKVLKSEEAEQQIQDYLNKALPVKVASLDCPEGIEMKQGNNFDCTAKLVDGTAVTVAVDQKDNQGNVFYQTRNLIITQSVEDTIQAKIKEAGTEGTVDCGPELRSARTNDMFDCKVTTAAGGTETLRIEVTNDLGAWKVAASN
jgi:hypothetical protein